MLCLVMSSCFRVSSSGLSLYSMCLLAPYLSVCSTDLNKWMIFNPSVDITASSPLYNGSQALLSCNVELDPMLVSPQNSVMVTWRFGTVEVFGDNFLTVSPLVGDGRTYQRNLTFQTLFLSDTGNFICEATIITIGGNTSTNSSTVHLSVEGMCMLSY